MLLQNQRVSGDNINQKILRDFLSKLRDEKCTDEDYNYVSK